jgi:hypothetical protein
MQSLLDGGEEDQRRGVRTVGDGVGVERPDVVEQRLGRANRWRAGARDRAATELGEYVGTLGQQVGLQLLSPRSEPLDRCEHQRRHCSVNVAADKVK